MKRTRWWLAVMASLVFWGALAPCQGAGVEALPPWFKLSLLDLRDDLGEARQGGRRLLLYFHQEGCPYCAKLVADNFGQKHIADKTRAAFDVVAIDVRGDRELTDLRGAPTTEKRFAEAMRVMFTPTLLVLDEEGRTAVRLNGYYPPHKFDLALDYAAGRAGKGMHFSDYMTQAASRAADGVLHQEPWFLQPPFDLSRFRTGGPRLAVLFEQRECGACDEFHKDVLGREESRKRLSRFAVAQLDLRADLPVVTPTGERTDARAWARQLGVQYAPTLVFFDEKGAEAFRIDSWLRPTHFDTAVDYVASGAWRETPFQNFLRARLEAMRARGEPVNLME